ncbi:MULTISPECIES: STAS domain-containing protein [unclassified Nonomuraea]|uniref:STAS domain-containing protein n=1 Tax=unclassified Nonomuraea TaxID=2593643 RepID=UPI0033C029B9
MTPLLIDSWDTPGAVVVTVAGEIDTTNALRLQEYLTRAARAGLPLVLDFAAMTFMDSKGLQVLVHLDDELRTLGSGLQLAAVQGIPARLLEITGVADFLTIHPSVDRALTALDEPNADDSLPERNPA